MSDPTKPPAVAESKRIAELEKGISPGTLYEIKRAAQEAALREALEGKHVSQPAQETPRAEPVAWLIIDHGVTVKGVTAKRTPFVTLSSLIADRWADTPDTTVEALFLRAPPPPDATSARVREETIEQCAMAVEIYYQGSTYAATAEGHRAFEHDQAVASFLASRVRVLAQTHVQSEQAGEK